MSDEQPGYGLDTGIQVDGAVEYLLAAQIHVVSEEDRLGPAHRDLSAAEIELDGDLGQQDDGRGVRRQVWLAHRLLRRHGQPLQYDGES